MLYVAVKRSPSGDPELRYDVIFLKKELEHETVTLKAICGPGDTGEPVITIMLPRED